MSDKGVCFILAESTKEIEEFHAVSQWEAKIISEFGLDKNTISEELYKKRHVFHHAEPIINLQKHLSRFLYIAQN